MGAALPIMPSPTTLAITTAMPAPVIATAAPGAVRTTGITNAPVAPSGVRVIRKPSARPRTASGTRRWDR
jgi:hypothetical protein